jgi:multicomponent Na+:H+ antiporter subunit G
MSEAVGAVLLIAGGFFVLVAALGVLRLPDAFMRMHAATKAGTLGAGLVLVAAAVVFGELAVAVKGIVVFLFLLLTAPVAAHVLGRAAYYDRVTLWDRTHHDDLHLRYEDVRHGRPDPAPDDPETDED